MPSVVLLASDLEVRGVLTGLLAGRGIAVVTASDATQAIARVLGLDEEPALVLVDRRLARGSERELLEWMRSRSRLQDVPIVLFTVHGRDSDAPPIGTLRDAFEIELVLAIVDAVCAVPPGGR